MIDLRIFLGVGGATPALADDSDCATRPACAVV